MFRAIASALIYFLALMPFLAASLSGNAAAQKTVNSFENEDRTFKAIFAVRGFIFPASSTELIDENEIASLDCEKLWAARNEIFYRNGYCFADQRGARYFGTSNCRRSGEPRLSELERRNVRRVRSAEREKGC